MEIRTVLLSLICIGFLLIAGCTSTTPAAVPATPVPETTPDMTYVVPATSEPVTTAAAELTGATPAAAETTVTLPVVVTSKTTSPVKIFSPLQSYSPEKTSNPGLDMSVITSLDTSTAKYDWSASQGYFVTWNPPHETANIVGSKITTNGGKVYWTFSDAPADLAVPVTITVVVSEASGKELGRSTATLAWKDAKTVTVKEIV